MKKKSVIAILFTVAVLMTSCGQKPVENTKDNTIIANTENQIEDGTEVAEKIESTESEEINTEGVEIQNTEYEAGVAEEGGFLVQIVEQSESYKADDGREVLTSVQSYPKLSAKENAKAAEVINADIESMQADDEASIEENVTVAKEDYAFRMQEVTNDTETMMLPYPYQIQITSVVTRNDKKVFSFAMDSYAFLGGAHGNGGTTGYNYDAVTGKRLKLEELSEDSAAWKEKILSFVKEQCESDAYKERLYEDYETYLEDAVFAENNWYFDENGILISCSPYSIGCYASGSINFEIPYETLRTYGLNENYLLEE